MITPLQEKFYKEYCAYKGYDGSSPVIAGIDKELSIRYPVLVKKGCGHLIITVVRELTMAVDELCTMSVDTDLDSIMSFLFDEGISYEKDISYIGALDKESFAASKIPENIEVRLLSGFGDRRALSKLQKTLTMTERMLAQVSMKDEMIAGVFVSGELVCAASTIKQGNIHDIGVMTAPSYRKMGYARHAITFLMQKLFEKDENAIAQYRCDKSNEGSVSLMNSLGFEPMLELFGAIMDFSGDNDA